MKQLFFLSLSLLISGVAMATDPFPQGFETITAPKGDYFVNNSNYAPVELADNPNISGINISSKVAKVSIYSGAAISGIIKISFTSAETPTFTYPTCASCTGGRYDRLRFKYYKGNLTDRYIEFEPNGQTTSPKTLIQAAGASNEWEYIVIPLDYATYNSFQIRVNRNASGGTATAVSGDVVYVDDFELYNSTDGVATAIATPVIETADLFSCVPDGNNSFKLTSYVSERSNVCVDLISLDGRSQNIYNQSTSGNLEIPFNVKNNGMYFVRMTVNNEYSKTIKILSR